MYVIHNQRQEKQKKKRHFCAEQYCAHERTTTTLLLVRVRSSTTRTSILVRTYTRMVQPSSVGTVRVACRLPSGLQEHILNVRALLVHVYMYVLKYTYYV